MKSRAMFATVLFAVLFSLVTPLVFAEPLDRDEVNPLDRPLMFEYSKGMDTASDYTQYAAFLMPAAFFAVAPTSAFLETGVMYAASSVLALGSSTALKYAVERDRPYMYFDNAPQSEIDAGKADESFPSRHSAMAFSGAAFVATLFAVKYPDSKYRVPATAAAYALAATTAALRIGSGSHFATDVLAGAAIGTISGFVVPFVASKAGWVDGAESGDAAGAGDRSAASGQASGKAASLSISPNGIAYTIRY
jgi:membrane-associated phospholipid phosphatase